MQTDLLIQLNPAGPGAAASGAAAFDASNNPGFVFSELLATLTPLSGSEGASTQAIGEIADIAGLPNGEALLPTASGDIMLPTAPLVGEIEGVGAQTESAAADLAGAALVGAEGLGAATPTAADGAPTPTATPLNAAASAANEVATLASQTAQTPVGASQSERAGPARTQAPTRPAGPTATGPAETAGSAQISTAAPSDPAADTQVTLANSTSTDGAELETAQLAGAAGRPADAVSPKTKASVRNAAASVSLEKTSAESLTGLQTESGPSGQGAATSAASSQTRGDADLAPAARFDTTPQADGRAPSAPSDLAATSDAPELSADAAIERAIAREERPAARLNALQSPRALANDLALQITKRAGQGAHQFEIQLDPPELGRINVKLEVDAHGKLQAAVTADNAEALDVLSRDARTLERALQNAGLDVDAGGLAFNMAGRDGNQASDGPQGSNEPHDTGDGAEEDGASSPDGENATSQSLVDVRV